MWYLKTWILFSFQFLLHCNKSNLTVYKYLEKKLFVIVLFCLEINWVKSRQQGVVYCSWLPRNGQNFSMWCQNNNLGCRLMQTTWRLISKIFFENCYKYRMFYFHKLIHINKFSVFQIYKFLFIHRETKCFYHQRLKFLYDCLNMVSLFKTCFNIVIFSNNHYIVL